MSRLARYASNVLILPTGLTLGQAYDRTERDRWRGLRSYKRTLAQAQEAVQSLGGFDVLVSTITLEDVRRAVRGWLAEGLQPSTCCARLSTLSVLGVPTNGAWPTLPRRPKWYLDKETHQRLRDLLTPQPLKAAPVVVTVGRFQFVGSMLGGEREAYMKGGSALLLYADWAVETGLRVEESLRLTRSHFVDDFTMLKVPGTKTASAVRTLPLTPEARALAIRAFKGRSGPDVPMFEASYQQLSTAWRHARKALGITDPLATLKAFRRSAARRLHVEKGLPFFLTQKYLGHSNGATTQGYLNTIGSFADEMRKYLG